METNKTTTNEVREYGIWVTEHDGLKCGWLADYQYRTTNKLTTSERSCAMKFATPEGATSYAKAHGWNDDCGSVPHAYAAWAGR